MLESLYQQLQAGETSSFTNRQNVLLKDYLVVERLVVNFESSYQNKVLVMLLSVNLEKNTSPFHLELIHYLTVKFNHDYFHVLFKQFFSYVTE